MAKLEDKIQNALDEGRMLVLGAQILIGFQYRSAFEKNFDSLPRATQYVMLGGLVITLIALALLLAPAAYHRIVAQGEDTRALHQFATSMIAWALLPFALGLGIDLFVATEKLFNRGIGIVAGLAMALVALFFWYGLEALHRATHAPPQQDQTAVEAKETDAHSGGTPLKNKIRHVLTEARVVLPGAQALLGFQLATILLEGFDRLPNTSKYTHLVSLGLIAFSTVLLMTPAAYHRIVEQGEETEHFHRFASRTVLAAMALLALGICGDLFVVVRKVSESTTVGIASAFLLLVGCYGLWFAYTVYLRSRHNVAG